MCATAESHKFIGCTRKSNGIFWSICHERFLEQMNMFREPIETHTYVMNRIWNGMCATAWYCVERHLFYWSHIHYVATPFILDYVHHTYFAPQPHTAVVAVTVVVVPLAVLCARGNSVRKLQQQQTHCVCSSTRMCGAVTNSYCSYLVLISVSVSPNLFASKKITHSRRDETNDKWEPGTHIEYTITIGHSNTFYSILVGKYE